MTMELRKFYIDGVWAGGHSKNELTVITIRHGPYWWSVEATGLGFYFVMSRELK